jgi:phosphopantetheinyl transferase (holo-ACP synthase)
MIGNDVVDLVLARKKVWRRTGYLQKIFTESEQLLIENSSNPHVLVWKLWSMKEAAYKIIIARRV